MAIRIRRLVLLLWLLLLPAGIYGTSQVLNSLGRVFIASGGSAKGPDVLVETLIGAGGALVVLAFVFASMLALLALLIAASSILTTLLVVLGVTTFASVSFIVLFLVSLVGLGVAIDHSLLIVARSTRSTNDTV
jgi:putative drug exporter of the RND superfamily